jgi:hypothetical protein
MWWLVVIPNDRYPIPLPPNPSLQTCQCRTCLEWPKQRVKTVQFSRPVVLLVRFGENLFKEWEVLRKLSYFGLLLGFWELAYVLSVPGTSVFLYQICEVGWLGDHSQDDFAKFGYRVREESRKVYKLCCILVTCWNLLSNYGDFTKKNHHNVIKVFVFVAMTFFSFFLFVSGWCENLPI